MSTEGRLLIGLTIGGALVVGTLPELLVGMAAGYIVYVCHRRMVTSEQEEALKIVEDKIKALGEGDKKTKANLEALKKKIEAKLDTATFGSSIIGIGAAICPPAGVAYVLGRYAWKKKTMQKTKKLLAARIQEAKLS
jgi:hypothetical protein